MKTAHNERRAWFSGFRPISNKSASRTERIPPTAYRRVPLIGKGRGRPLPTIAYLAVMLIGFAVHATSAQTIVGPSYPPEGGTLTFSSSGVAAGSTGGRNWNYANFVQTTGWNQLYWGPSSTSLPSAGLDGTSHALTLNGIAGNTATWSGTTSWTNPTTSILYTNVPLHLRVTVTGLGINPWVLSSSVAGLDPGLGSGIGAVVENSAGTDFTANLQFLADIPTDGAIGFIALNNIQQAPSPGSQTRSSFGGAFYSVVPEPGSLALLGLGGLLFLRRRRESRCPESRPPNHTRLLCSLTVLVLLGAICPGRAATVVVPGANAGVEANEGNAFPFGLGTIDFPPYRYQQVYAGTEFSTSPAGLLITKIAFRLDTGNPAFFVMLPDVQINLSTTSRPVDGLGSFDTNPGLDDTVVYARGSLALSSAAGGPPGGPQPFDIAITLQTPFLYLPAAGNLLLDVRNWGGFSGNSSGLFFDTQNAGGDSVSRRYYATYTEGYQESGDTRGLVTQFTGTSVVPEPGSLALLALGGLLFLRRRSRSRAGGGDNSRGATSASNSSWPRLAAFLLVLSTSGVTSVAAVVDVTATGSISQVGSGAAGSFTSGDAFIFTFRFDTATPASFNTATEASYPAVSSYSLSVTHSGGNYLGTGTTAPIRILDNFGSNQLDAFQFDQFSPGSVAFPTVAGAPLQYLYLNISNLGGTPLATTALPASINLSAFSNRSLQVAWSAPSTFINASVSSLTFTPVPEPGSLALLGLGGLLLLRRARGGETPTSRARRSV